MTEPGDKRRGGPVPLGELMRDQTIVHGLRGEIHKATVPGFAEARDREIAAARQADQERLDAEVRKRHLARLRHGGVPERRLEEALVADETAPAIVALSSWGKERNILVLAGPIGVGKTVAAVWWLHGSGGKWPLFVRANEFEARGRYDHEFRDRWGSASGMVLDDLGCEYADARGNLVSGLDELIDVYSGRYTGLLITTNLRAKQFGERYGERITSRVHKFGHWRNVKGADRRREC